MEVIERYFDALARHDWRALSACLAEEGLVRTGPFADVVHGRDAYVAFLQGLMPTLRGYRLEVAAIHPIAERRAVAELSETMEVDGALRTFPEAIFFGLDAAGRIAEVTIYIQQPGAEAPVPGGRAGS
jgi:limonene-1,2-epoxide hydrolase